MDYKTILESVGGVPRKEGGMSAEEALEMQELFLKIRAIDLEKVQAEKRSGMTALDKLIHDLNNEQPLAAHRKTLIKKKTHYKTLQAKRRKRDRNYYHEVLKPRRSKELATTLLTPEGWWKYLTKGAWRQMGTVVELTYDQFVEHIYPVSVELGYIPIFFRYDPKQPLSLSNLLVKDSETRKVLFCGKEYVLRSLGAIL